MTMTRRLCAPFLLVLLFAAAPCYAQRIGVGLGIAAPLNDRNVPTQAHTDNGGIVRVDRTLDSSPQLFIELHTTWKLTKDGKFEIGPMLGFVPHVDFGATSNATTEQPVGAGFGMLLSAKTFSDKKRLNFGVLWMISAPIARVNPAYVDGFQAPRDSLDRPTAPTYVQGSVNRVAFTVTFSGIF